MPGWLVLPGQRLQTECDLCRLRSFDHERQLSWLILLLPFQFQTVLPLYCNQWDHVLLTGMGWYNDACQRWHWYLQLHGNEFAKPSRQVEVGIPPRQHKWSRRTNILVSSTTTRRHFLYLHLCQLLINHSIHIFLRCSMSWTLIMAPLLTSTDTRWLPVRTSWSCAMGCQVFAY